MVEEWKEETVAKRKGPARSKKLARDWEKLVKELEDSGESVRGFCQRRRLPEGSLYAWRRELRLRKREAKAASLAKMAPVEIEGIEAEQRCGIEVELSCGRSIRVRPGFDEKTLERVVTVLEGQRC